MNFVFIALAVALLGAFAIYCDYRRPGWYPFAKGLPALVLILALGVSLFAVTESVGVNRIIALWILFGLILGLAGDLFLLKKEYFLYGLGAFLLGHLCYVVAFAGDYSFLFGLILLIGLFGSAMSAVLFYFLLRAGRKAYLVPVLLYIVTICFMLVYGIHFDLDRFDAPGAFALGAVLFALSDSLLSINRFVRPFAAAQLLVLGTYYAAQLCITAGALVLVGN